jgi:hypothetical protein
VIALVPSEVIEEQVQTCVDVGETFVVNVNRIEVDLNKFILMIK